VRTLPAKRMTSSREGLLKQHPHEDMVFVGAIDQNAVALQSFGCKADFLVELDRDHVAFPNRQFDPAQPEGLRRIERLPHQTPAYALPPEFRQNRHAKNADMGMYRPWIGHDIAPADDQPVRHRDQLWITMLDIVENEGLHRFERRGFQKREIAPLPCDEIEGSMKAFDMVLSYWNNFD
jgi:hypothetical protein